MSTFKKLTLGMLVSSLILTFGLTKQSDIEYECENEENSLACVKQIYTNASNRYSKSMTKLAQKGKSTFSNKYRSKMEILNDALDKSSKYCKNSSSWLFSDKKQNKINGLSCQYSAGLYLQNVTLWKDMKPAQWIDIDKVIKVAETGCNDLDNFQSCLILFDLYHPKYAINDRIKYFKEWFKKISKNRFKKGDKVL